MLDLQKASLTKRISAAIFDFILLTVAIMGFALILNTVLGYDAEFNKLQGYYESYEQEYNVKFNLTAEEYEKMTEAEKAHYQDVQKVINKDEGFIDTYSGIMYLTFIIASFSILLAHLFLEFVVPLLFKNGQTLGKKIFSIGLMREDGVRITPVMLFIRTVLGKYTVLTMIPVIIALMIFFGSMGIAGTIVIFAIWFIQLIMTFATKNHTALHDKMSVTVAVDMQSQLIFDTPEALMEYKNKLHNEKVEQTKS